MSCELANLQKICAQDTKLNVCGEQERKRNHSFLFQVPSAQGKAPY
jgi:hypothetical protein